MAVFSAPSARTSFVPLSQLFPTFVWPEDQFEGGTGVLDRIFATSWSGHPGFVAIDLFTEGEVALGVPGIDGLELILGASPEEVGPGISCGLALSFGLDGSWALTLSGLSVTLRWDSELLVAMAEDGAGGFVETGDPYGVTLTGSLTLTDDWGIDFDGCPAVDLPPVQIGHTGVVIRADDVVLHFGRQPTPPELSELGYGDEFRGVYMRECEVFLPGSWGGAATETYTAAPPPFVAQTDSAGFPVPGPDGTTTLVQPAEPVYVGPRITFSNCAIGTGGFSGDIAFDVDASADVGADPVPNLIPAVEDADRLEDAAAGVSGLSAKLFGFGLALQRFELGLRRNAIVSTGIDGSLKVPFLDTWFDVEVAVTGDGGFEVSIATESGEPLVHVTIEDVVEFILDSIGIEDPGDGGAVGIVVNGTVRPLLDIGSAGWPELDLQDLKVFADGSIALAGGWLSLPTQYAIDFFGFQLELAKIGFGTGALVASDSGSNGSSGAVDKASDWRWVGLSGAIRLVDELAISGSVDGLKIGWRPLPNGGFEWDWSLSGIGVGVATDVFSFQGAVAFFDDEEGRGFRGAIALTLATFGLGFEAEFLVGRTEPAPGGYTFWGVILGVDLPAGIPLGPSGVAFYGLKGIGSQNLTPDINPSEEWYEGWYKRADLTGKTGVTLEKFKPEKGALGFGLGVTLGTAPDNGFTVCAKALALFLLPGPTIIIAGKAGFMQPRSALDGSAEPPFESLLVIEGEDGSLLLNIAAHYNLIDERVLSIAADAEAYFPTADPSQWYLHIGQPPLEDRISVKVLSLFEALGYLTIENSRLLTGFRIGFGETWKFGKLELGFNVHISGDGGVSLDPVSVFGRSELSGGIHACAFGVCLGLSVEASMAARAFSPLFVSAHVSVAVDLPAPLPTLSPDVKLLWKNDAKPDYADPFTSLRVVHAKTAEEWEPSTGEDAAPFVPMDARPVVTFSHAVADQDLLGQPASYVSDPPPETVGDYEITYTMTSVSLAYRPHGGGDFTPVDDLYGVWLLQGSAVADDPAEVEAGGRRVTTKLELWGRTPFSYEDHTTIGTTSVPITEDPDFPCGPDVVLQATCIDWQEVPSRTRYPLAFEHGGLDFLANTNAEVALEPPFTDDVSFDRALAIRPWTLLVATLPGSSMHVSTLVESLGSCVVQAWGTSDGTQALLESHTVTGRNDGVVRFAATGVERIAYWAMPSTDCAPWSWQVADDARVVTGGARAAQTTSGTPGRPGPIDFPGPIEAPFPFEPPGPLDPRPAEPDVPTAEAVPDDANLPRPITAVPCSTLIYQICWAEEALTETADQLNERRESFRDWTDSWAGSARVLGPNTTYRLTVSVQAAGVDDPQTFTRTVYFRTQGPPGFLAETDNGKGKLLADLALYVDRTAPPAGAGLSLTAPFHYRAHDVVVLYNRDYVKTLYAGKLFLELVDANGAPVTSLDGSTLFEAAFTDPSNRVLTTGETLFVEAIDGSDCSSVTMETVSPSSSQGFAMPVLAASTLHQARILGGWSDELGLDVDGEVVVADPRSIELKEVLRWEFVTSRYEGFAEHAASYDPAESLWDGANAFRPSGLDVAAAAAQVRAVQGGTAEWDEAEKAAADELLRLLGVGRRVPPERLEVTAVRSNGDPIALLVDSPEPFDWPRIAMKVSDAANGRAIPHVLARARDGRRALLFRTLSGAALRAFRAAEVAVGLTYDLAIAPSRYRAGVSGTEAGSLAVPLAEESP